MRGFALSALLIAGLSLLSGRAAAADLKVSHGGTTYPARAYVLPFPRNGAAQSVWASDRLLAGLRAYLCLGPHRMRPARSARAVP